MNEKLLILYLERILGGLFDEIRKADKALGPDVDRVEIKQLKGEETFASALAAVCPEMQETDPEPSIAKVLLGLENFALYLSSDIDDLHLCDSPETVTNVCGFCGEQWEEAHTCTVTVQSDSRHPDFDMRNYHSMMILSELKAIRELLEKMWADFPEHGFG